MTLERAWAGVDIGKHHHHAVVVDIDGNRMLSKRVKNDEQALLELIGQVAGLADRVHWAVDIAAGESALLLTLLAVHDQTTFYITGAQVNRASDGYRGAGKTDAKDAAVIADQARLRRDLAALRVDDELVVELRMLVARRRDLASDRVRMVNRLHQQLTGISPALEQALDLTNKGPLILLTQFQTPTALRQAGVAMVQAWLKSQKVRSASSLAIRAVTAAQTQHTTLSGQRVAAELVAEMAHGILGLDEHLKRIDKVIEARFRRHRSAETLLSMPGIGPLLGAEFLAATGGDMSAFASSDHLAGYGGFAPVPRDSGRVSGNLHRPRRYHRGLQRVFYTSALISIQSREQSRNFYQRKRSEGKHHNQAVLALARRRVNVIWALLRDNRRYTDTSAEPAVAAA